MHTYVNSNLRNKHDYGLKNNYSVISTDSEHLQLHSKTN